MEKNLDITYLSRRMSHCAIPQYLAKLRNSLNTEAHVLNSWRLELTKWWLKFPFITQYIQTGKVYMVRNCSNLTAYSELNPETMTWWSSLESCIIWSTRRQLLVSCFAHLNVHSSQTSPQWYKWLSKASTAFVQTALWVRICWLSGAKHSHRKGTLLLILPVLACGFDWTVFLRFPVLWMHLNNFPLKSHPLKGDFCLTKNFQQPIYNGAGG